jgi:hypothetical protein
MWIWYGVRSLGPFRDRPARHAVELSSNGRSCENTDVKVGSRASIGFTTILQFRLKSAGNGWQVRST